MRSSRYVALLVLLACAAAVYLIRGESGGSSLPASAQPRQLTLGGRGVAQRSRAVPPQPLAVDPAAPASEFVQATAAPLEHGELEVAGEVVDGTGGPVAGAIVTLATLSSQRSATILSGADGTFAFRVAPGNFMLCARAEAYSEACTEAMAPSNDHLLTLVPASMIVGKVLERRTKRPLAGVTVVASNRNGLRVPARGSVSAADGSFSIDGLATGGYELVATSSSTRSAAIWVAIGVGEASAPVTLWAEPAVTLSGVVLVGEEPCARGFVTLSGPIWASQQLPSDGNVRIEGVLPGRYETRAHCGAAFSRPTPIDIGNEPLQHTWRLEEIPGHSAQSDESEEAVASGGTIRVTIDGTLSKTSRVFAENGGMHYRGRRTGTATFVFENLPAAAYRVFIDDDVERAQRAEVADARDVIDVQLTSREPAWIVGRVATDSGMPVPDAWVSAFRSDVLLDVSTRAAPVLTDEQGLFRLPAVTDVNYTVQVASPLGDSHADGVEADREVVIRVSPPASLTARVQTAEGGPVPDFTLSYGRLPGNARALQRGAHSTLHVPMLEPGSYRLQIDSALGSSTRDVELTPADEVTVTMTLAAAAHDSTLSPINDRQTGVLE